MTSDDDRFVPCDDEARDVLTDNGLPEHCASQDVPDCAVGGLPHLLQLELYKNKIARNIKGIV